MALLGWIANLDWAAGSVAVSTGAVTTTGRVDAVYLTVYTDLIV